MTFIQNLNWRYATKIFNGLKVEQEKIEKILDSVRLSPSSFGTQPYHLVIVSNKEILQKLKPYAKNNQTKIDTASHLLVFCARTDVQSRFEGIEKIQGRPKGFLSKVGFTFQYFLPIISIWTLSRYITKTSWARNQTYIALGFAMAACAELFVDSCAMEGFDSREFSNILNLPKFIKPSVLLAIGYRSEDDKIFPKTRFPRSDIFTFLD